MGASKRIAEKLPNLLILNQIQHLLLLDLKGHLGSSGSATLLSNAKLMIIITITHPND